ncbi:hypothetical protein [Gleimia hominis]|nr:hypothetical protein [Gleimia hominis]WIK63925.1 hypothetical protein CJ187_006315 [Gleimia hominis]
MGQSEFSIDDDGPKRRPKLWSRAFALSGACVGALLCVMAYVQNWLG